MYLRYMMFTVMKDFQQHTIREFKELSLLRRDIGFLHRNQRRFRLRIRQLTQRENERLEHQLTCLLARSSCRSGRVAGAVVYYLFILIMLSGLLPVARIGVLTSLALFLLFTLLGMIISRAWNHYQTRKSIYELQVRYESSEKMVKQENKSLTLQDLHHHNIKLAS